MPADQPTITPDDVLSAYVNTGQKASPEAVASAQTFTEAVESQEVDHGCYTELPVPQLMLDVQFKDKTHLALPYHDLQSIRFDPSGTITMVFTNTTIVIKGTHLDPLYRRLQGHYVTTMHLSKSLDNQTGTSTPKITSIQEHTR